MPTARSMPMRCWSLVRYQKRKEGRNENVSVLFHISSHAVAGRLACLSVVSFLVIFNVTPPPE
jgi:hypothetical protein